MDKTFEEAISGIRHAERGVEVREDIAQGMEYVQGIANASAESAEKSAASAESAKESASGAALSVSAATEQAEKSASSAVAAESSKTSAKESSDHANESQANAARYLQATKEYFEQVRTITIGAQGWYATPEALKAAVPVGENGWWAVVGTTDTIWTWDSDLSKWKDSAQSVDLSDYLTKTQVVNLLAGYMPLRSATASVLGGIKVGDNLTIDADGTLALEKSGVIGALSYTPAQVTAGTADLTAGSSYLATGTLYVQYDTSTSDAAVDDTDIHMPEDESAQDGEPAEADEEVRT